MDKLDLTKQFKTYFTATTQPQLVNIEAANFISIVGKGDPGGPDFATHIEALYSTAYTLKFVHKAQDRDFVVSKLEGLWWFDEEKYTGKNIETAATEVPRSEWEYRLLIRMPDFVTRPNLESAIETVRKKKALPLVEKVQFYTMQEGKCVQMLHVGPFSTEVVTLKAIDQFIKANNFGRNGLHHEIYLSDFRKTPPEKLKTILREPVK